MELITNRKQRVHPCQAAGIHVEKCGATGKISYRSENAAKAALEIAHGVADTRRRESRYYLCRYGNHWHLTSSAEVFVPAGRYR